MTTFLMHILAYFIIWIAVDYGRPEEYRHNLLSKAGIIQFILITAAGVILTNVR